MLVKVVSLIPNTLAIYLGACLANKNSPKQIIINENGPKLSITIPFLIISIIINKTK